MARIEISNLTKNFGDLTALDDVTVSLEQGQIVGLLGPNGSGKSNIADALRWVLGEQSAKSLRGSKMEDVIFGGADSRRPMGYAEVSVTFDNTTGLGHLDCPYDEVTVTRRYYRAGESEYFINRRAVRLKDVYELFMNTGIGRDGYSIIGQGRIAEMVSRKSEERRSTFEDASGIAKYRYKKNEAERKLKAAKKQLLGQLAISSDNGETQCLSMGKGLLAYGKITDGKETRELVDAITAEDVREMACRIFAPENLSRLIYI